MRRAKKGSNRVEAEKVDEITFSPDKFISWQAPEFEYRPKDVSWYWLSLLVAIFLVALALWQKNFLFAIFVLIAWLVVIKFASRKPLIWEFRATQEGIEFFLPDEPDESKKAYSYEEIEGFDVHFNRGNYKELLLNTKSRLSSYLKINFPSEKEKEIISFLEKFLPRQEYPQSLIDTFLNLIGF